MAKDPFKDTEDSGLRIALSGKTGTGYEAGLINVSGSVEDVAEFLKLDPASETFQKSPFAAIVGTWNAGHHWAQGDYHRKGEAAREKASGKA